MQDYHQLDIWQRAMVYVAAATSVPLNIAEGSGCPTNGEFARFLSYAYRSLKEVVTCLELSQRLYPALSAQPFDALIDEGNQISRMTRRLIERLGDSRGTPEFETHSSSLMTHN